MGHSERRQLFGESDLTVRDRAAFALEQGLEVTLCVGETRAERKPLHEIDKSHLYEPGPAKHALAQLLQYSPDDEVVFRRPDGAPVTAREMLRLLQEDDATAVDFLRNLHGAALRIVRLDARRAGSAA